jgi:3-hydroxyacyl-[acyl-carrier protein] dehydratase/trans-2-decenoyl-[acyl-carrier protein] isomerase
VAAARLPAFPGSAGLAIDSAAVLPTMKNVVYGLEIKRVMRSKLVLGIADGWLSADGSVIYRALDLKVGLFRDPDAMKPSAA